jgi:cytochrome P450
MTTVSAGTTLAELEADPYPAYARLRQEEPVAWLPDVRQWLVTRWPDVERVLTDPELFTTDMPEAPSIRYCGGTPILFREGADHRDVREAFIHDYDPHRVIDYVDTIARPNAERIAGQLFAAGRADLASEYFEPIAVLAEATLLGVGPGGAGTLRRWGNALARAANNFGRDPDIDADAAAVLAEGAEVDRVIERLRGRPDESVLAHLIHANRTPTDTRPDADVLPVLKHVAMSVIEPGWLAGFTLLALWSRPEQYDEVRRQRSLLGAAVYEALRWSAPVGVLGRRSTRAITLGGKEIPEGAMLAVSIASANRDETAFTDPDSFDVHRTVRTHLGFGTGPHDCPAFPFVTAIARTALDVLFDRMPKVRPAPGWQPAPHGWKLRLPGRLDVVWD